MVEDNVGGPAEHSREGARIARHEGGGQVVAPGVPFLDGSIAVSGRAVWPGLVVVLVGALALGGLLWMVEGRTGLALFDDDVLAWFVEHRSDSLTAVATPLTAIFSSSVLPIVVVVLGAAWWAATRRWREPLLFLGSMGLMLVLSTILKRVIDRPRPPAETMSIVGYETTGSFPSGHTIAAATFGFVGAYLVWALVRTTRVLVIAVVVGVLIPVVIACTRLYLGYHYLTDVAGGACAAVIVFGLIMVVDRVTPGVGSGPRYRTGSHSAHADR